MVEWCTHTGNGNPSILKCLHASRITSYNLWGAGIFLTSFLAWLEIVTNVILCVCVFDTQSKMCEFLLVGHALIGDKQTICSVFLCCFWMFVVFFLSSSSPIHPLRLVHSIPSCTDTMENLLFSYLIEFWVKCRVCKQTRIHGSGYRVIRYLADDNDNN